MLNGLFSNFAADLPMLLLGLPVILLSLSVHEMCHGYAAFKLGDPTARNLGRLTLNPIKHIDPVGFICMILFHVGWASPVPINTRNFKKPRRDMALSAAAGPLSNVLLALVFGGLLRLALFVATQFFADDLYAIPTAVLSGSNINVSRGFVILVILTAMLFLGVTINFSYALFNLLPIPPLDGSRIFHVFLPTKWYFGIMKYERIIAIVLLALLWMGILTVPLNWAVSGLSNLTFSLFGIGGNTEANQALSYILFYISSAI